MVVCTLGVDYTKSELICRMLVTVAGQIAIQETVQYIFSVSTSRVKAMQELAGLFCGGRCSFHLVPLELQLLNIIELVRRLQCCEQLIPQLTVLLAKANHSHAQDVCN